MGVVTPTAVGEDYYDFTNHQRWIANGLSFAAWEQSFTNGAQLSVGSVGTTSLAGNSVSGPKLSPTGVKSGNFAGRIGPGSIPLLGAAVGDRVFTIFRVDAAEGATGRIASFQSVITVADQIQQTDPGNLTGLVFVALLLAPAA
jgi:hypothetical protein